MAFLIDQSDSKYLIMEEEINRMNYLKRIEQNSPELVHQNSIHPNIKRLPKLEKIIEGHPDIQGVQVIELPDPEWRGGDGHCPEHVG